MYRSLAERRIRPGPIIGLAVDIIALTCFTALGSAPAIAASTRVASILERGELVCGLPRNVPGFAVIDDHGGAIGFDADLCRAIATTILGTGEPVRFVQVDAIDQFLSSETIDLVFHGLTSRPEREARWNIAFGSVTYLDGQGFAVRAGETNSAAKSAVDIRGPICIEDSSRRIANLRDWLTRRSAPNSILVFARREDAANGLRLGKCEAWSSDVSVLGSMLAGRDARSFRILSERISIEPLAAIVRGRDKDMLEVIKRTVASLAGSSQERPSTTRYDEIYERHFGNNNWPEHGTNQTWRLGGAIGK